MCYDCFKSLLDAKEARSIMFNMLHLTSSFRATNKAERFSAWAKCASNLSSSEDNTQKRMSESASSNIRTELAVLYGHARKPTIIVNQNCIQSRTFIQPL